jgi:hypothetical protein
VTETGPEFPVLEDFATVADEIMLRLGGNSNRKRKQHW